MYGKKRIVINKKNQIILAGKSEGSKGGSWIPIGIICKFITGVDARFLMPEKQFENTLNLGNSISITNSSIKKIREEIKKLYELSN